MIQPLDATGFELRLRIDRDANALLDRLRELKSHDFPDGDPGKLIAWAIGVAVSLEEKRRFGTGRAARRRRGNNPRSIPLAVKKQVWERDGGQCTFVSDSGHRCDARRFLQFDHIKPVGKDGEPTVPNLRLRCHAHNQLEAERVYGAAFMEGKRARHARPA